VKGLHQVLLAALEVVWMNYCRRWITCRSCGTGHNVPRGNLRHARRTSRKKRQLMRLVLDTNVVAAAMLWGDVTTLAVA
jgi:hypothetical protein